MIRTKLKTLIGDALGATAIEYGLIVGLVVVAMLGGLSALGGQNGTGFEGIKDRVTAAVQGSTG